MLTMCHRLLDMLTARPAFRPKHQVLILKCYPKFQKNISEVKPNSSELSYLLYYSSTRRSKLQKVGAFLEKKTAVDVSKGKLGNVQVTLQIITALIEKTPRDLPLYTSFVLNIIATVLQSKDLSMIEESIPTFQTFCKHQRNSLATDQKHVAHYADVVAVYASFAALKTPIQPKGGLTAALAIQWRTAGLQAVKSAAASEAIGADDGRLMNSIIPVILQNLHSGDATSLHILQQKAHTADATEREQAMRRRMSIATVRTGEPASRPTSLSINGAMDDADRLAEEEVSILAIQSLKDIFTPSNRGQVRLATSAMLKFVCAEVPHIRPNTTKSAKTGNVGSNGTWANAIMETVTRWTPVQDRFVILMTLVETLVRSPTSEEHLEQHLLLTSLIDCLLKSNINMIGLSVMDVLLALVQHILLLLRLGGVGLNLLPYHAETGAIDLFKGTEQVIDDKKQSAPGKDEDLPETSTPSSNRQELLMSLQKCIGDLAAHIYYSDQISDIIAAILHRLKPSPASSVSSVAAAIEPPQSAAQAVSGTPARHDSVSVNEFFSFGTARVSALKAIKEVLVVANAKGSVGGAAAIGRSRVNIRVWEGTQWLLRDEDRRVRRAYVDALLTWMHYEISPEDQRAWVDKRALDRTLSKTNMNGGKRDNTTKRARSKVREQERDTSEMEKSTFLQLLHLAVYENAITSPEAEDDLLLLHLLMYQLTGKLGVNAVKSGLPMVMRLQEDIDTSSAINTPNAKINIASLCHGYFWSLSDKFDFDTSTVGYVIQSEIVRRKKHGLWIDNVQVPPLPIEKIITATARVSDQPRPTDVQNESVKPFDARPDMVEKIAEAYLRAVFSPPSSPPASPSRAPSMPILSGRALAGPPKEDELPAAVKEKMLAEWTKEVCITEVEQKVARASSLTGSKRGVNHRLTFNSYTGRNERSPNGSPVSKTFGENDVGPQPQALNFGFQNQKRQSSAYDTESDTVDSDKPHVIRFEELKRILDGEDLPSPRNSSPLRQSTTHREDGAAVTNDRGRTRSRGHSVSTESNSVASADGFESASEGDPAKPLPEAMTAAMPSTTEDERPKQHVEQNSNINSNKSTPPSTAHSRNTSSTHPRSRPYSGYSEPTTPRSLRRPSTSSSAANEDPEANAAALRGELPRLSTEVSDEVPPVPPLPAGVAPAPRPLSGTNSVSGTPLQYPSLERLDDVPSTAKKHASVDKKRNSAGSSRKRVDIKALLASIDALTEESPGQTRTMDPPY